MVEWFNHTPADMLSMYVRRDWDESLTFVTFAYNISRVESMGRTLFYPVYGGGAILPVSGALNADPNRCNP